MDKGDTVKDILCFLQNQWERDADDWNQRYERMELDLRLRLRQRIITGYICNGHSMTAKRLQEAFGNMLKEMTFENASPRIGNKSSDKFPPDLEHIKAVIDHVQPLLIVTFGKIAHDGVSKVWPQEQLLPLPHPVARQLEPGEWKAWRQTVQDELEGVHTMLMTPQKLRERLMQQFPVGTRVCHRIYGTGTVLGVLEPDEYEDVYVQVSYDDGDERTPTQADHRDLKIIQAKVEAR